MNHEAAKNYIDIHKEYDVIYKSLNDVLGEYSPIGCLIKDLSSSLWDSISFENEDHYVELAMFIATREFDKAYNYITKVYDEETAAARSVAATEWVPAIAYTYRIYELFHKRGAYHAEVVYESNEEQDAWDYFDSCCNSTHSYVERYYIDTDGNTHYQEWNDTLEEWINIATEEDFGF